MTESDFIAAYAASAYPAIAVTTDVALFSTSGRDLGVGLIQRAEAPEQGRLALPGVFVRPKEDLDRAAMRALSEKAGIDAPVRQFKAFGAVDRDPRLRVVSIGFMAALPAERVDSVGASARCKMFAVRDGVVLDDGLAPLTLPFDHREMIADAVADLRRNLDHTNWVFNFLPREFSLRELQRVHEAIRGRTVNKPAFRTRLLDSGWLEATGRLETNTKFRPAELYRAREVRGER